MTRAWDSAVSPAQTWAGGTTRSVVRSVESHRNISLIEVPECRDDGVMLPRIGLWPPGWSGRERRRPTSGAMRSRSWMT